MYESGWLGGLKHSIHKTRLQDLIADAVHVLPMCWPSLWVQELLTPFRSMDRRAAIHLPMLAARSEGNGFLHTLGDRLSLSCCSIDLLQHFGCGVNLSSICFSA